MYVKGAEIKDLFSTDLENGRRITGELSCELNLLVYKQNMHCYSLLGTRQTTRPQQIVKRPTPHSSLHEIPHLIPLPQRLKK